MAKLIPPLLSRRADEYGAFYSGWPTFSEVYPLFGPGKGQGTLDIRVPSNYLYVPKSGYTYGLDKETQTVDLENPLDPQWEDKEETIYCASRPRPALPRAAPSAPS